MGGDHLIAGVVTIVALLAALFADAHGFDSRPYFDVALGGGGYAAGSIVAKRK